MQGENGRLDARREGGERPEEGGQAVRAEGGRDHAALATSAIDTAVRRYRRGQTDIRDPRIVCFFFSRTGRTRKEWGGGEGEGRKREGGT